MMLIFFFFFEKIVQNIKANTKTNKQTKNRLPVTFDDFCNCVGGCG